MPRSYAPLVVGLVSGSHVINHAYLLLFPPAFTLLGADLTVSLAELGVAVGVVSLVVTAGQLPLGYVSDNYSHAAVLLGSLLVGTLGCAMAAAAPTYEWLLVAAAVMGAGVAGHHPAHYPLISAAVPDAYRARAYSAHGFTGAVGLAVPFAVVPASVALGFGWRSAFAAIAVLGAVYTGVAAVAVRRVPASITRAGARADEDSAPESLATPTSRFGRLRSAGGRLFAYGRTVANTPVIVVLTTLWFVNSVAAWGIRTYAATLLDAGYGLPSEPANLVASVMLVVGAVVLLGGGYVADRTGPLPLLYAGYGSLVVLAAVLSSVAVPLVAAVGLVLVLAATIDFSRPARSTLTDLASERGDVGKNFALMTVGISGGGVVAPPIFGYLIETSGVGVAFLGVAAAAGVALALSVLLSQRLE